MDDHDVTEMLRDRAEIASVLIRYATALDTRDWQLLDSCFTTVAVADYGALAGVNEGLDAIKASVRALDGFDATQHLIGNIDIDIAADGEHASATCYLQAQHVVRGTVGGDCYTIAGTYRDGLVRTDGGWRIVHRTLQVTWTDGNPRVLEVAAQRAAGTAGSQHNS